MLYFDESGYTGQDLANKAQPFFTLASTNITNEEAKAIKENVGYDAWGKELHFKSMYTNPQGRIILDKLFKHPLMNDKHIKLSYGHKRFCIYAQIVDILIETFYHENGINIYVGAKNLFIANGMFYGALVHPNQELVEEFERYFVKMVRKPSPQSIADFYRIADNLRLDKDSNEMLQGMLWHILQTRVYTSKALNVKSLYMDLTLPLFVESIEKWYEQTGVKHDILFDSSEPFFANKDLLESLRDMNEDETKVGYGNNKHVYPLPVGEMNIAKSHEQFGIQIADIYASALNFILTPRTDKFVKYQKQLRSLPIFQSVEINVAPSTTEYIMHRMKDVKGIDPLDFICEHANISSLKEKKIDYE